MNNQYELQRHVMPTTEFTEFSELFVNISDTILSHNNEFIKAKAYKFNTWMNMFAAKKHYHYCDIGEIYLKLKIQGSYRVQVVGTNRSAAFDKMDTILVETDCQNDSCTLVPNAKDYDGLYFTIFENSQQPIQFLCGSWATDKEPLRDNSLAVCICTFKREEFITKNIRLFENFIESNPSLKGKIKLFISDNGKSLPDDLNSVNVTIYPNMNAGGAGGFTRCLMEVLKQNRGGKNLSVQGFGRVCFMDDDVEIFAESFYRTLILSNYLKNEFKDAVINGAMLDLYNKSEFFENLAIQDKLWVNAYHKSQGLDYRNILKINDIPDEIFTNKDKKTDSAWWYHCFDISFAENKGLPVPVFFRGDDVEWSWRHFGTHHISMNGICVWHSPFAFRVSKTAESYYLPRNMFFINSIYTDNFKQQYKEYFSSMFNTLVKTYDYVSCEIFIRAMKDILKGSAVFRENPSSQFSDINKLSKMTEYFDSDSLQELMFAKNYTPTTKPWRNFIYKLTNSGMFCPKFLFKSWSVALDWYPSIDNFTLVKEVKVYNLLTGKYELRKFDKAKYIKYTKEFKSLLSDIDKNYDILRADFMNAHKEFITMDFWNQYLDLSNETNTRKETSNV